MKNSSQSQVKRLSQTEYQTITRNQIYLAVAFIYIYFITAIFF